VNHLKIAQSFINKSLDNADGAALIRAIANFARDVGVEVIAQGVETEQQSAMLASTGLATQAQGFHFSKAVGGCPRHRVSAPGSSCAATPVGRSNSPTSGHPKFPHPLTV
jgi:EAL domain-containing protein (putative c-di-GMP-specific phosphodiesterase class I)